MARLTLIAGALMMFIIGVLHLVAPQMMLDTPGIRLQSVSHFHLVRAAYGGSFLGTAALFALGVFRPAWQRLSLVALACLFSGWVLGRLVSLAVDGWPSPLYLGVLAAEVLLLALAVRALRNGPG